jgi:alpha-mannosidase
MRHLATAQLFRIALAACLALGLAAGALFAAPARAASRIYLANDDHTDYFWTGDDVEYRAAFLHMLDYYMAQAESTASNPPDLRGRFNCDGSLWVWEYERNKTPAEFARLVGHLRDGTLTMPLNPAVLCYGGTPAEAVLRGMYYAGRLERRYALRFPLALAMENQTLPGGLASLWAGAGARYSWRGVCGCATRTVFEPRPREIYRFLGPDGQGVCMKWNTLAGGASGIGGYFEASDPSAIVDYLDHDPDFKARWPWDVSAAFGFGGDSLQTTSDEILATAERMSNGNRRVIVSNEVDFFEDFLANHGGEIPAFSGSFGNEWELQQASMAAVTGAFRREVERLRTAEALATVASLRHGSFMNGREAARDAAFMAAGMFYEHDWTADGLVPAERRAQFQRDQLALLQAYVESLHADALATVAADVRTVAGLERHLVFNPLSWARTDVVDLATSVPEPRRVVDVASGEEMPSQSLSAGVVRIRAAAVPSVGYRVYEVQPQAPSARPAAAAVTLPAMDNGLYRVALGARGEVTSLLDRREGDRELVGAPGSLNDLGFGNGPVVLERTGPVSTTLRVSAPGWPAHETRVTLYAGVDRVDFENTVTQNFTGTLSYGFGFDLPGAVLRHEEVGMIARAAYAADGGDYADQNARTDYLSLGHFADFSQAGRGVTLSNADGSFFQYGHSTPNALDTTTPSLEAVLGMQVDGPGLGIPDQGGDTQFLNRYALRRHGAYDPASAMRFALEHQNPLVGARLTGGADGSLSDTACSFVSLPSSDVVLWALKPAEEGIGAGIVARVWNLAEGQRPLALSLPQAPSLTAMRTTHLETDLEPATVADGRLTDVLERQQMRTYRLLPSAQTLATPPGGPAPVAFGFSVFPNPLVHAPASIAFRLAAPGRVRVCVRDVRGATVATLWDRALPAGPAQLAWDRRDSRGDAVRPGVYFVEVEVAGTRTQRRVAVLE